MTKPYHVKIAPEAKRQLLALPIKQARLILKLIEALAVNPRPPGTKKIEGMHGLYSEAVNNHRLIYKIEDQDVLILFLKNNKEP